MYRAKPGPLGGGEDGLLPDRGSATSTARPGCPVGTPHRVTTFRLTLSRAMACRIARLSSECMSRSVRVADGAGLRTQPSVHVVGRQVPEAYSQPRGAGHVDAGQGACLMITERVVNKPPYPVKSSMDLSVPYSVGEGDSPKQLGFAVLSHEV
jgi:hypothetical protein